MRERGWAAARGESNDKNPVATTVTDRNGAPVLFLLALGPSARCSPSR